MSATMTKLADRVRQKVASRDKAVAQNKPEAVENLSQQIVKLEEMIDREKAREEQKALERADAGLSQSMLNEDAVGDVSAIPVMPPADLAGPRPRHWLILISFVLLTVVPTVVSAWYLWTRAADRYVSYAGFSVRTEEVSSAIDLLGGVAGLSGSSSSDPQILYAFIRSQDMVARIDARLDLRGIWARVDSSDDPVYAYHPPGTIEDMTVYWQRMVKAYNDDSGLIDLEVQAFTAEDAHAIAAAIYDESTAMINKLSAIARADATSYAKEELDTAVSQLREARVAMTQFRNRNQIVDPTASVQSQMGLLSSLQLQLAETLIDLDILRQSASQTDPRVTQAERRVEVIRTRIAEERRKLGIGAGDSGSDDHNAFADIIGDYERLQVDLEFAEQSYTAARAAYGAATAEARRQSRYLAAHVQPTLPQRPEHPRRVTILGLVAMFAFLTWALVVLSAYALRDRR